MQTNQKHLYIIGIGGVGTVWIADWALERGWKVSGSDISESASTKRLSESGANIHYGTNPELIPEDITEAVITSAITESSPSYPEYLELKKRKLPNGRAIPINKRAKWIGKITRQSFTIGISGTHGKTTTTAMVGWILDRAGLDPTVFVGGTLKDWGAKTKIGKSNILVIEADEYDRSFHNFKCQMVAILNIDTDHLDYYKGGLPEIEHSFKRFLRNLPSRPEQIIKPEGIKNYKNQKGIVVGLNSPSVRKICKSFAYKFRFYDQKNIWAGLQLRVPGYFNLLNATAAAKICHEIGVSKKIINEALAEFPGVNKRFEYVGKWNKVEVYDDYAHHPSEIAATLSAIRERFPKEHVTLIFQAHQKARVQALLKEFGRCFDQNSPDTLILAPIYQVAGREVADINISNQDMAREVGPKAISPEDNIELEKIVIEESKKPGILVTMGAGNIRQLVEKLM